MQDIERQIADLERKLALKRAYQAVQITFGKGYKSFPETVRKEVEEVLLKYAQDVAENIENPSQVSSPAQLDLDRNELAALKILAQTILAKGDTRPSSPVAAVAQVAAEAQPSKGTLLLLDNLSPALKKRVDSGATVTILQEQNNRFYVKDAKGNGFWIPQEDIELQA